MTGDRPPIVFPGDAIRVPLRIDVDDLAMTTVQLPNPSPDMAAVYPGGDRFLVIASKVDGCTINYGSGVPVRNGARVALYVSERAPGEYAWFDAATGRELGAT